MFQPSVKTRDGWGGAVMCSGLTAAILAALSGCVSLTPVERTLPRATESHFHPLQSFRGVEIPCVQSRSYVWNRVGAALASTCGVAAESFETGTLESNPCYATAMAAGGVTAVQTRTRVRVIVPPGAQRASDVQIVSTTERRTRDVGAEVSAWVSVAPDEAVAGSIRGQLSGTLAPPDLVPLDRAVLLGAPQELLRRIELRLLPYVVAERNEQAVTTDWRSTQESMDPGLLTVRSRLRFIVDPTDGGSVVHVVGELQYLAEDPESKTPSSWIDLDAAPIVAHGSALALSVSEVLARVAPEESLTAYARAAQPEPDLPEPSLAPGALPAGVYQSRATMEVSLSVDGVPADDVSTLLGKVLTSDLSTTAGRFADVGRRTQPAPRSEVSVVYGYSSDSRSLSVGAGLSIRGVNLGVDVSSANTRRALVFSFQREEAVVRMADYVRPQGVGSDAAYFVEGVVTGRSVDVACTGTDDVLRIAGRIGYQALTVSPAYARIRASLQCTQKQRGVATPAASSGTAMPSLESLYAAAAQPGESVPIRIVLRRVPDEINTLRPRSFEVAIVKVRTTAANSAGVGWDMGGYPDLLVSLGVSGEAQVRSSTVTCPDDQVECQGMFGSFVIDDARPTFPVRVHVEDSEGTPTNELIDSQLFDIASLVDRARTRSAKPLACEEVERSQGYLTVTFCVREV